MYQLHCNKCFRRHKEFPATVFQASVCGHVVCASCLHETCPICSRAFKGVIIDRNMPHRMADYFGDPLRVFQNVQKTIKFHYDQEWSLVEHINEKYDRELDKIKQDQQKFFKIKEELQKKFDHGRDKVRRYQEYIERHERKQRNTTLPLALPAYVGCPDFRSMSEPPQKKALEKGKLCQERETSRHEDSFHMKPSIIGRTVVRYPAPQTMAKQTNELKRQHNDNSVARTSDMMPPPSMLDPRLRYPRRQALTDPTNKSSSSPVQRNENIPHHNDDSVARTSDMMPPPLMSEPRLRYPRRQALTDPANTSSSSSVQRNESIRHHNDDSMARTSFMTDRNNNPSVSSFNNSMAEITRSFRGDLTLKDDSNFWKTGGGTTEVKVKQKILSPIHPIQDYKKKDKPNVSWRL